MSIKLYRGIENMKSYNKIWNVLMDHNVYRIINLIIYIFYFVPSDYGIDYIPYLVSFFWGIVLLVWDFFTKRLMFKQSYWYLLIAFCISYVFSILTNLEASISYIGMNLVYIAISVFIFYTINPELSKAKRNKHFQLMNDIFIVITFVLAIVSIVMFLFGISYVTAEGARQGFIENRLFGVYTSPNVGSMFGYASIILALVNNYFKRGSWKKFQRFYIFNVIIQYISYMLSSSRGTRIAIVAFFVFLILISSIHFTFNQENSGKKIVRNILIVVGLFTSFNFVNQYSTILLSYAPSVIYNITNSTDKTNNNSNKTDESTKRQPIRKVVIEHSGEEAEVSSGRFTIWEAGFELVKQKPIFGVADSFVYRNGELSQHVDEAPLSDMNKRELERVKGNMHNTYVALLVKGGVVGFIVLAIFVILILKEHYLFIKSNQVDINDESIQVYIIILAFILSLFVNDFVETHLILNNRDVIGLLFWSYLSFLNHFRHDYDSQLTHN